MRFLSCSFARVTARACPREGGGRGYGRASVQIREGRRGGVRRQGSGEDQGLPHREAQEPEDWPALSVDRALERDGEPLLCLCGGPRFRPVLPQVLHLLSIQCQAVPERARIPQPSSKSTNKSKCGSTKLNSPHKT